MYGYGADLMSGLRKLGINNDELTLHSYRNKAKRREKVILDMYESYLKDIHGHECTTHTFVLFKSNLTWYHFEHSWYSYRGIHMGSKNIEYSLHQIINKWSSEENITVNKIIIRELLEVPTYGADMFEYMDYAYRFPIINLNKGGVK